MLLVKTSFKTNNSLKKCHMEVHEHQKFYGHKNSLNDVNIVLDLNLNP